MRGLVKLRVEAEMAIAEVMKEDKQEVEGVPTSSPAQQSRATSAATS